MSWIYIFFVFFLFCCPLFQDFVNAQIISVFVRVSILTFIFLEFLVLAFCISSHVPFYTFVQRYCMKNEQLLTHKFLCNANELIKPNYIEVLMIYKHLKQKCIALFHRLYLRMDVSQRYGNGFEVLKELIRSCKCWMKLCYIKLLKKRKLKICIVKTGHVTCLWYQLTVLTSP